MPRKSSKKAMAAFDAETSPEYDPMAKRRPWSADEDEHLKQLVGEHGIKSWAAIATRLRDRNGKQCRERWRNHLRPQLFKGEWTPEEDQEIWDRVQEMGTKWAQISEQYMPSRTDNDIKNRWNSIIRKAHAPGGREWEVAENEMRALFLGSASRTQSRKNLGGNDRRRPRASGDAKKTSKLPKPSPESPSPPAPGRKLFDSPLGVGTDGEKVHTPGSSRSQLANAVEVQLVTTEDVHDVLLEGEISAETFDVEAFLPESYAAGTLSALSSPVSATNRAAPPSPTHMPQLLRFRADERMWRAVHAVQAPRHHVVRRGPGVPVSDCLGPANVRLTRAGTLRSERVVKSRRTVGGPLDHDPNILVSGIGHCSMHLENCPKPCCFKLRADAGEVIRKTVVRWPSTALP